MITDATASNAAITSRKFRLSNHHAGSSHLLRCIVNAHDLGGDLDQFADQFIIIK